MDRLNNMIVTDILDIFSVSSPKGRYERMNNRKCYGLSFCAQGQITYTHNGRKFVSDPEHAVILPEGQSYTIYGDKSGVFPLINFKCFKFLCDTLIVIPIKDVDAYIKDYEYMKTLFLFERNSAKVMSIFYGIIHRLSAHGSLQSGTLTPAIKYLEDNYTDTSLTNQTLARQCGISEVYFRKLFTEEYGITPRQYLIDIRINKAKQLLTDGMLKISTVCEKSGFSNPYHFCRLFKEKTGLTPTEYMKQNRIFKI